MPVLTKYVYENRQVFDKMYHVRAIAIYFKCDLDFIEFSLYDIYISAINVTIYICIHITKNHFIYTFCVKSINTKLGLGIKE